jgi:hypothetical protein
LTKLAARKAGVSDTEFYRRAAERERNAVLEEARRKRREERLREQNGVRRAMHGLPERPPQTVPDDVTDPLVKPRSAVTPSSNVGGRRQSPRREPDPRRRTSGFPPYRSVPVRGRPQGRLLEAPSFFPITKWGSDGT